MKKKKKKTKERDGEKRSELQGDPLMSISR